MRKFDAVVVGSGISGLTLALLLGLNGKKVLLLEKFSRIGGSLARFVKQGIPFDTGFQFTGGFSKEGILHQMLTALGIRDGIEPVFMTGDRCNQIIFTPEFRVFDIPPGTETFKQKLKDDFPGEQQAINRYFEMASHVCDLTVAMNLRKVTTIPALLDEDYVSLDEVLNGLTDNRWLKAIFSGYSMCHGVNPPEISFANHSRICSGLYESVARVKDGGDAFIRAFQNAFTELDIEIACGRHIVACEDVRENNVGRFVLSTGEEITCDHCIFTIHPKEILNLLPREHLSKAFVDRISEFEPSPGFFSVFGVMETDRPEVADEPTMVSLFSTTDINQLLDPSYEGQPALVIMRNLAQGNAHRHQIVNAFEISFPDHVRQWQRSKTGDRPPEYLAYKNKRVEAIREQVAAVYPEHRERFKILDAASVLTFRDYLHSPDGSAYGIKQKMGQINLFGKLPLRNVYAAGQSAVLPGIVGAMMSSFIICRSLIGKGDFTRFIEQRLSC